MTHDFFDISTPDGHDVASAHDGVLESPTGVDILDTVHMAGFDEMLDGAGHEAFHVDHDATLWQDGHIVGHAESNGPGGLLITDGMGHPEANVNFTDNGASVTGLAGEALFNIQKGFGV